MKDKAIATMYEKREQLQIYNLKEGALVPSYRDLLAQYTSAGDNWQLSGLKPIIKPITQSDLPSDEELKLSLIKQLPKGIFVETISLNNPKRKDSFVGSYIESRFSAKLTLNEDFYAETKKKISSVSIIDISEKKGVSVNLRGNIQYFSSSNEKNINFVKLKYAPTIKGKVLSEWPEDKFVAKGSVRETELHNKIRTELNETLLKIVKSGKKFSGLVPRDTATSYNDKARRLDKVNVEFYEYNEEKKSFKARVSWLNRKNSVGVPVTIMKGVLKDMVLYMEMTGYGPKGRGKAPGNFKADLDTLKNNKLFGDHTRNRKIKWYIDIDGLHG